MEKNFGQDFYEIQSRQWKKSLFLFSILIVFYFFAIGLISIAFLMSFGLFLGKSLVPSGKFLIKLLQVDCAISIIIAYFHFYDARKFGAKFILKRLQAQPPDLSDRYHKQFADTVDEIRIASGLPKVNAYVLPSFAINSMALVEADKTPAVVVTEGLLSDCTRDELQAVAAHELAHITRGDAFYITLVCSLANFFERFRQALEPEDYQQEGVSQTDRSRACSVFLYLAVTASAIVMHLLSTLISREREILADAAGVELCRNPLALARVLYKAHLKNSFVGDFNLTYSPLFIVAPESKGKSEGPLSNLFNSHPPLMKRIKLLAQMAKTTPAEVIEQVWETQKNRDKAKGVLLSFEEMRTTQGLSVSEQAPETETEKIRQENNKVWLIRDSKGNWQGPFALQELLSLSFFTSMIRIKNLQEGVEAPAREFSQIRNALYNLGQKKPISAAKQNHCPRCNLPLADGFYEGVPVKSCNRCLGKLVDSALIERILTRKEVTFSEDLLKKARQFKQRFLFNPIKTQKISSKAKESSSLFCPSCGYRMVPRPYNYQYFVPVDKCLSCYKIWFDADELEILQILIEKRE
jgi:heat shock protein HtpX